MPHSSEAKVCRLSARSITGSSSSAGNLKNENTVHAGSEAYEKNDRRERTQ